MTSTQQNTDLDSMADLNSMTDIERFLILKNNRGILKRIAETLDTSESSVSRVYNGRQRNEDVAAHLEKHIGPLLAKLRKTSDAKPRKTATGPKPRFAKSLRRSAKSLRAAKSAGK